MSLPSREAWIEICLWPKRSCSALWSLPSREAWIEMIKAMRLLASVKCRFPRGKRGLKLQESYKIRRLKRRFPRGKRGLKFPGHDHKAQIFMSLPSREAWIEISAFRSPLIHLLSLPSREAWIEIVRIEDQDRIPLVASLAGSVD